MALRDLAEADVDPFMQAFVDDPGLAAALGHDDDPRADEVLEILGAEQVAREEGRRMNLALTDPATARFTGSITMHGFSWKDQRADVGFFVVPQARGAGVATEGLRLLVDWAFGALGLFRIGLATTRGNTATQRVAERAGFAREGVLRAYSCERGRRVDSVFFSRLADEGAPRW